MVTNSGSDHRITVPCASLAFAQTPKSSSLLLLLLSSSSSIGTAFLVLWFWLLFCDSAPLLFLRSSASIDESLSTSLSLLSLPYVCGCDCISSARSFFDTFFEPAPLSLPLPASDATVLPVKLLILVASTVLLGLLG